MRYWKTLGPIALLIGMALLPVHRTTHAPWNLTLVQGHLPDLEFSLTDAKSRTRTARDYHGRIVLLYFGFTGCGAQCPLTLQRLADALRLLRPPPQFISLLFVGLDPMHDTARDLQNYAGRFDATHDTGLYGTPDAIAALTKRYRALYLPDASSGPLMPHSDTVYIFDTEGRARLIATGNDNADAIAKDLQRLMDPS